MGNAYRGAPMHGGHGHFLVEEIGHVTVETPEDEDGAIGKGHPEMTKLEVHAWAA
jgi:hypothetical protein